MSKEDRQKRKEAKREERQKRALELAEQLRSRLEEKEKAKEAEDELNIFMCEECLSKITDIDDTFTIVTVPDGECDICHKREDNLYQVDMNHVHAK